MKQYFLCGAVALLLLASPVVAQSEDSTESANAQVEVTATVDADTPEVSKDVPSGFGFFWRGFKERVSLLTTVNPVKKAEKQLQFAEERLQIAKTIAEKSTDPKVQAKAEAMVTKANEYIQKIEEKKEAWIEKKDERSERLLKNIATHELNREKVMDRLEEKLPVEQVQKIREERQKHQELLNRLQNGDESAQADLDAMKQQRTDVIKANVEDARKLLNTTEQKKEELIKKAKAGDEKAIKEVRMIQKVQRDTENIQDMKSRPEVRSQVRPQPNPARLLEEAKRFKEKSEERTLEVEANVQLIEDDGVR